MAYNLCIDLWYCILEFINQKELCKLKINKGLYEFLGYHSKNINIKLINPIVRFSFPEINYGTISIFRNNSLNKKYTVLTMLNHDNKYQNIFDLMDGIDLLLIENENDEFDAEEYIINNISFEDIKIHLTELQIDDNNCMDMDNSRKKILSKEECVQYLLLCLMIKHKKRRQIYCEFGKNHEYHLQHEIMEDSRKIFCEICNYI